MQLNLHCNVGYLQLILVSEDYRKKELSRLLMLLASNRRKGCSGKPHSQIAPDSGGYTLCFRKISTMDTYIITPAEKPKANDKKVVLVL